MGLQTFPIAEDVWRSADSSAPWQVPSFEDLLQTSLVPGFSLGSPTPTFTRATTAYVLGYLTTIAAGPTYIQCASGEARFMGARRIAQDNWSVLDSNGVALTTTNGASTLCTDAGGPFGYLSEGAGTQLVTPTADIRDMTQVGWSKTTMTAALTAAGIDGAANSATTLTATGPSSTVGHLLVDAASSRTYSCYMKRRTGTGIIEVLDLQNGATAVDVTALINATTFTKVSFTASILNATPGIRITTSGDAIDVDFNQFEAGGFATSPMASTGAARNADILTYPSAGNLSGTQGSAYAEIMTEQLSALATEIYWVNGGDVSGQLISNTNAQALTTLTVYDGTNTNINTGLSSIATGVRKRATAWSVAGGLLAVGDGLAAATSAFDGTMTATSIGIGPSGHPLTGTIRNVRIYPVALPASKLKAMTTP